MKGNKKKDVLESAPAHLSFNDRYLLLVFPT